MSRRASKPAASRRSATSPRLSSTARCSKNALAAAFGAREKALEAQHAALSALNLPSAGDVERLERRLRSFSQRLEEVEEQLDETSRELAELRRRMVKSAKTNP